jgi:glycine dehydrogenase
MISIRQEIQEIVDGKQPRENNVLTNAPHPVRLLVEESWDRPYSRAQAVFPDPRLRKNKFWPAVGRLQESYGDLNLICECSSVEESAIDMQGKEV